MIFNQPRGKSKEKKTFRIKHSKNWDYAGKDEYGDEYWNHRGGGWIYLYNKGMFRDREEYFVISTSLTGGSNPKDRQNISFKTKKEALEYAEKFRMAN